MTRKIKILCNFVRHNRQKLLLVMLPFLFFTGCRNEDLVSSSEQDSVALQQSGWQVKKTNYLFIKNKPAVLEGIEKFKEKYKTVSNPAGKTEISMAEVQTDRLIYVSSGGGYESYTFLVERGTPDTDAENLVLVKQADGSYAANLVQYSEMRRGVYNGAAVWQGKVKIEPNIDVSSRIYCHDSYIVVGYTPCSANQHFAGEGGDVCHADVRSEPIYSEVTWCVGTEMEFPNYSGDLEGHGPEMENGGGGGSGGSGNSNSGGSIVTEPLLPALTPECRKLAAQQNVPQIRDNINSLKEKAKTDAVETLHSIKYKGQKDAQPVYETETTTGSENEAEGHVYRNTVATMHDHLKNSIQMFSPKDFVYFYLNYKFCSAPSLAGQFTTYNINWNGQVYALRMQDAALLDSFFAKYNLPDDDDNKDNENEAIKEVSKIFKKNGYERLKDNSSPSEVEKIFLKILSDPKLKASGALNLYKGTETTTSDGNKIQKWSKVNSVKNAKGEVTGVTYEQCN